MSLDTERAALRLLLVLGAPVLAVLGIVVHQAFGWLAVGLTLLVVRRVATVRCPRCHARVGLEWPRHCPGCRYDFALRRESR